jgi:hypothetical protein
MLEQGAEERHYSDNRAVDRWCDGVTAAAAAAAAAALLDDNVA